MSNYANSEKTRDALINAAGELAAEIGLVNVSTRAVAERAQENLGSIHYHFGTKEQLFKEVILHASEKMRQWSAQAIIDAHINDLGRPEVQSLVLRKLIHRLVTLVFNKNDPPWRSKVIFQILHNPGDLQKFFNDEIIQPDIQAMTSLIKRICPKLSDKEAYLHTLLIKTPLVFHADHSQLVLYQLGETTFSPTYFQHLEDVLVYQTQLLFGLPCDKKIELGKNL